MALDPKNLSIRTISGLVYAGLLVGVIVLGPLATAILCSLFAVIGSYELESKTHEASNRENWTLTWLLDAASLVCLIFSCSNTISERSILLLFWVILILVRFIAQIFSVQKNPIKSISTFTLTQFYIGFPLALLVLAVSYIPDPWIVVCAIAMIWISDTGAYITGSLFGHHKMSPRLSPKKSWEGFFGGLIFNIGIAFVYFYCFRLNEFFFISSVDGWIYIAICVTVLATLGDLFESLLKRSVGIKDFGNIIPGHGGVLDRIDSLLFVIPGLTILILMAQMMFGV